MALPKQGIQDELEELESLEVRVAVQVDPGVLAEFPADLARDYGVVPLSRTGDQFIVALARPLQPEQLRALSFRVGRPIHVIPAIVPNFRRLLGELEERAQAARRLGEILTEERLISPDELDEALERQQSEPRRLGEILVDLGFLSKEELGLTLAKQEQESRTCFDPSLFVDPEVLLLVPEALARKYQVLPLAYTGRELVVAAAFELDEAAARDLQAAVGVPLRAVVIDADEVRAAINKCYLRLHRVELEEMRLGDLLVLRGLITEDQLEECLVGQQESAAKLGDIVVQKGYASEDSVYGCVAEKLGHEFRRFSPAQIAPELTDLVSRRFAERHLVVPLTLDRDAGVLQVAMTSPNDLKVRDMLERVASQQGVRLEPVLATPSNVRQAVAVNYCARDLMDRVDDVDEQEPRILREDLMTSRGLPEIKQMINRILYQAVMERASDIHIESQERAVRVRFRIDGILEERDTAIAPDNIRKVISVLKIDAGLDIAERRRSQDGAFKKRIGDDQVIDFRINVHATKFGEDAVIRILDQSRNLLPLDDLGMGSRMRRRYVELIENPQGLILFTGPTGSGKTTTLYSTLTYLNRGDKKIVTAEDPVEYNLDGVSQYQVNAAIGNTFAEYGRRFLRKDPDIILIGEIRDPETADACISAAMTGHLVFSTLHTNDSIGVVQRLRELGIDRSAIADGLLGVVSQRLARRVCERCSTTYQPDPNVVWEFFQDALPDGVRFVHGEGCAACGGQGYRGRIALYEYWELDAESRRAVSSGVGEAELAGVAHQCGMTPLVADGLTKVGAGVTTLEELRRVVPLEHIRAFARD